MKLRRRNNMSIITFIFKSKRKMAKPHTCHVKIFKYTLTSHAQNRIVDKKRKIRKRDVIYDLYHMPLYIQRVKAKDGTQELQRFGRRLTSFIAINTMKIKSIRRSNNREMKIIGFSIINTKKGLRTRTYEKSKIKR